MSADDDDDARWSWRPSDERTLDSLLSLEPSPVGGDGELRPGPGRDSLLEDPGMTTLIATVPLSSVQRSR
jgi:hypothetical protein